MRIKVFPLFLSQHGIRAKGENLILSCFPCHQLRETFRWPCFIPVTFSISQYFPVNWIVVRKHSPPVNFYGELSGDAFSRHQPYQKECLEEISNFCEGTGTKRPSPRNFPTGAWGLFRRRASSSSFAWCRPASLHPWFSHPSPARTSFGDFCLRQPSKQSFRRRSGYFFSTPIPARALGSVLLPFWCYHAAIWGRLPFSVVPRCNLKPY